MRLSSPPLSEPFLTPAPEDAPRLAALTRELNTKAAHCPSAPACEQVHFSRALIALFESREAARTSFRRVISGNSGSPLVASSQHWLKLLDDEGLRWITNEQREKVFAEITGQLVRDWMDHQMVPSASEPAPAVASQPPTPEPKKADPPVESDLVPSLKKQVKERDRRIAELQSQLEALKVIDHDRGGLKKSVRPPATFAPQPDQGR